MQEIGRPRGQTRLPVVLVDALPTDVAPQMQARRSQLQALEALPL